MMTVPPFWSMERLNRIADTALKLGAILAALVAFPLLQQTSDISWTLRESLFINMERLQAEYENVSRVMPRAIREFAIEHRGGGGFRLLPGAARSNRTTPLTLVLTEKDEDGNVVFERFYELRPEDEPLLIEGMREGRNLEIVYPVLAATHDDPEEFRFALRAVFASVEPLYLLDVRNTGSVRVDNVHPEGPRTVEIVDPKDEVFGLNPADARRVEFRRVIVRGPILKDRDFYVDAAQRAEPNDQFILPGAVAILLAIGVTLWLDRRRERRGGEGAVHSQDGA